MNYQTWSWILGVLGLLGFYLAGKKVWWCWYINLFNQILWLAYSLISHQYGFLVATAGYTFVFTKNAYSWTKEHFNGVGLKPLGKVKSVAEMLDEAGKIRGISIGFELNDNFTPGARRVQDAMAVLDQDIIRPGWSPACHEAIVYNGQQYYCAHRENHAKALHLINHWTRADVRVNVTAKPQLVDLFWDEHGLSHVIEVHD